MLINKVMSSSRLGLLVRKAVIVKLLVNFLHNWMFKFHFTEARRSFLEVYPEAATNEDPVLFRSSIIPWWAWIRRSHLPEAELLNGSHDHLSQQIFNHDSLLSSYRLSYACELSNSTQVELRCSGFPWHTWWMP